jgi:CVNH domain.
MAFQISSYNIRLERSVLHADCKNTPGDWIKTSLDLNEHIGNRNGRFTLCDRDWYHSARNVQLIGSKVKAELAKEGGEEWVESILDLNLCVENKEGYLKSHKL